MIEHILNQINDERKLAGISDIMSNQILWIINVPSFWKKRHRSRMKWCAEQAGMPNVSIALDCHSTIFHVMNCEFFINVEAGERIMILDCGGLTVDASCISINPGTGFVDVDHSESIQTGSLLIEYKFLQLLKQLLPPDITGPLHLVLYLFGSRLLKFELEFLLHLDGAEKHQMRQWLRQRQEFVSASTTVPFELKGAWNVPFCFEINKVLSQKRKGKSGRREYQNLKDFIEQFQVPHYEQRAISGSRATLSGSYKLGRSNLKINRNGWLHLYEDVLFAVEQFVTKLFRNETIMKCRKIILVGGFANSKFLQARLQQSFPNKTIYVPNMPHLTVMKGALYWFDQNGDAE